MGVHMDCRGAIWLDLVDDWTPPRVGCLFAGFQEHWPRPTARTAVPPEFPPFRKEPDTVTTHQQGAAQEGTVRVLK